MNCNTTDEHTLLVGAAFDQSASRLFTGGANHDVRSVFVWNLQDRRFDSVVPLKHYKLLRTAPDGFITVMEDNTKVTLLDPETLEPYLSVGECYMFSQVDYTSDACYLASISPNGHPCFWNAETGNLVVESEIAVDDFANLAFVLSNENHVLLGHEAGFFVWDSETDEILAGQEIEDDGVYEHALSPDKKTLACVSDECKLRLFETETWTEVMSVFVKGRPGFCGIHFAPDNKTLLICGETKVSFVDIESGDLKGVHRKPRDWELRGTAVSPCNDLLACVWQTPGMRSCIETMNISSYLK